MKHLSAKQNLGYSIQVVNFKKLFHKINKDHAYAPRPWKWEENLIWVDTFEFYKKLGEYQKTEGYDKNAGHLCNTKPVDGKYHRCVYELKESIEQEGMQYPIPVRMNPSEKRLEFFSGMARIRYATIHNYDSIDAIISEENDILFNLQEIMKSDGLRDRVFSHHKRS